MPPRYRTAVADHPQVLAWAREVARTPPSPRHRGQAAGHQRAQPAAGRGRRRGQDPPVRTGPSGSLAQSGVGVRWRATTAADLYAELRPRSDTDSEQVLATYSRVPLLILDDLGAAKSSEFVEEQTYRLINRRYNHMLPTLITTNLRISDLRSYLGDRVTSRLAQMTTRVEFEPVDRRRHRPAA